MPARGALTLGACVLSAFLVAQVGMAQPPSKLWHKVRSAHRACSAPALADASRRMERGDAEGAIRAVEEASRSCPSEPAPFVWLGEAYAKQHDSTNAAAAFATALQLGDAASLSTTQALTAVFAFARVGRNHEAYALGQIAARRAAPSRARGLLLRTMGDVAQQLPGELAQQRRAVRAYRAALLDLERSVGASEPRSVAVLCRLGLALALHRDGDTAEAFRVLAPVGGTLPIGRLVKELPISEQEKEARQALFETSSAQRQQRTTEGTSE